MPTHCTGHPDSQLIKRRQAQLEKEYNGLSKMASTRHQRLQESLNVQEFCRQAEEEEAWIKEKEQLCTVSPFLHPGLFLFSMLAVGYRERCKDYIKVSAVLL